MVVSLRFSRAFLLVGATVGLVILSGAIFALAFLALVLSGWNDQAPAWQIRLDRRLALWALLLNGANIALLIALTLLILNPMRMFYWVEQAMLRVNVMLIILANVAIITIIYIVIYTIQALPLSDAFNVWLRLLPLTSIASSASVIFAIIATQQLHIPSQYNEKWTVCLIIMTHVTVAIFSIVTVLSFAILAETNGIMPIMWTSISMAIFIIICLSWRQKKFLFTLAGTFTSAFTFSGACFYALFFYSGMTWYPMALTAAPLLLFLVILLRRKVRL